MFNPVVIPVVESYDKEMLLEFILHNKIREEQFTSILAEMKQDYQELLNRMPQRGCVVTDMGLSQKVQYYKHVVKRYHHNLGSGNIAMLSMGIQKGKYDGTDKSLKKLIRARE